MDSNTILLLVTPLLACLVTYGYRKLAIRFNIVSVPNERTLHSGHIPRGGGVVIVVIFVAAVAYFYARGVIRPSYALAFGVGGAVIGGLGFLDDIVNLSAKLRFSFHVALSAWTLICLGGLPPLGFGSATVDLGWPGHALALLGLTWLINSYNFMDGIDAMAASGAVFFSGVAAVMLFLAKAPDMGWMAAVLGAATLGFLVFGWPPAKIFLGDAGSTFFGYIFGAFIIMTIARDAMSLWTWIIIMGYFIADTTTTTLLRIKTVDKWYGPHRSHAYQNLARVWDNHLKVTGGVIAINVLWLLPLALLSIYAPRFGWALAVLALAPLVAIVFKYGPLYDK